MSYIKNVIINFVKTLKANDYVKINGKMLTKRIKLIHERNTKRVNIVFKCNRSITHEENGPLSQTLFFSVPGSDYQKDSGKNQSNILFFQRIFAEDK